MENLIPWPGIEPRSPALETWSLSHWTTGAVPGIIFFILYRSKLRFTRGQSNWPKVVEHGSRGPEIRVCEIQRRFGQSARLGNYEKNEWSWCLWGATGWGPAPGWTGHTGVAGLGTLPLHLSKERGWLPPRDSEAVSVPACPSCVASLSPRMPWLDSSSSIWVTTELGLSWSLASDSGLSSCRSLLPFSSVQLLSHVWLCNPMDCSVPGLPLHHQLPEFAHTHVHRVSDAIQQSHPLSSPSPAFNLSQHQGLFKWVSSSHQVAKVLELQLQHQSFQWIFRTDLL